MALRPCLDCHELIEAGPRCPRCQWQKDRSYAPTRLRGRRWTRKRVVIMRRNDGICERCQSAIAEEVHHVDGDPGNNAFQNLLALCRRCHVEAEAEKRAGPAPP